jgi:hypothetical protein
MKWFCSIDGDKRGPISSSELKEMVERGELRPTDFLKPEDEATWRRASEYRELFRDRSGLAGAMEFESASPALERRDGGPVLVPSPAKRKGIICKICDEGRLVDGDAHRLGEGAATFGWIMLIVGVLVGLFVSIVFGLLLVAVAVVFVGKRRVMRCDRCGATVDKS